MARKKSTAEDIIEITKKFPWWLGATLALISYFFLHSYANKNLEVTGTNLGQAISGSMLHGLASIGQYVLPMLFGVGAVMSLIRNIKRKDLYGKISANKKAVADISWQQFELVIGEYFRRQGYQVKETGTGADGGVDLVLWRTGEKYLVQCKHWKAYKVGVKPVRELVGVMVSSGASGGFVVTSGQFTRDAIKYAGENKIILLNGNALEKTMVTTKKSKVQNHPTTQSGPLAFPKENKEPVCPKCKSSMVLRTAKKGKMVGQEFWGCSKFPACRSIVPKN